MTRTLCSVALLAFVLAVLVAAPTAGQVPSTDIYLAPIVDTADGVALGEPANLTNREGYDNQPAFSPDGGTIYYTSERDGQTDLYALDLESKTARQVTDTPESEYSPTPIPGEDALSTVRVEADEKQRLWRFPLDGGTPSRILDAAEPVGYHAWSGDELVLFVLGEPHELRRATSEKPADPGRQVATDIGRALHKIPGKDAFSFVHKAAGEQDGDEDGETTWWVKSITVDGDTIEPLVETFADREDLAWSPDGMLWMADGTTIHRWCPACGEGFWQVADFAEVGLGEITRLAVSPDGKWLAFVVAR
ncbi:MAG: hypothetical protein AAGE94_07530 [Acidobacteriota bacterium]